jgi:hypothetical protein
MSPGRSTPPLERKHLFPHGITPCHPGCADLLSQLSKVPAQLEQETGDYLRCKRAASRSRSDAGSARQVKVTQVEDKLNRTLACRSSRPMLNSSNSPPSMTKKCRISPTSKMPSLRRMPSTAVYHRRSRRRRAVLIQRFAEEQQRIDFHRTQTHELSAAVEAAQAELDTHEQNLSRSRHCREPA